MSYYDNYKPEKIKPKRELYDLTKATVCDNDNTIVITDENGENTFLKPESILAKIFSYDYKLIKVRSDIASILLDEDPMIFDNKNVEIVDE